jgi:long-chain acyl-CoA synthetase
MLLHELLLLSTERFPEKTALVFNDKRYTYSQLTKWVMQFVRGLREYGLKRNDRVVIYLDNCPEVIAAVYGVLTADGVFVVVSNQVKYQKLTYIINNCEASYFLTATRFFSSLDMINRLQNNCPSLRNIFFIDEPPVEGVSISEFNSYGSDPVKSDNIDIDIAGIIYTSGSTGFPKGVTMAHLNMVSAVRSITTYLRNTEDDIVLDVLPLSFDYGLYQVLMCYYFGGTLVLQKDMVYIYKIIETLQKEKVTGFPIVPTILSLLLRMKNPESLDLSHLRYISNTGAALQLQYIRQFRSFFPHVQVFSMYGLTECKRVSYLEPEEIDRKPTSVGKAMPNLEVMIVDDNWNVLRPNTTGRLVVRGTSVMQGYWNDKKATDERIKQGSHSFERFLDTGDLFKMDEEGYLYFVGRNDDLLKVKGERVAPREVENILCQYPGVAEAAVIGKPDEEWGSRVTAFVVPDGSNNLIEINSLLRYCKQNLEDFAVPKELIIVKDLPRNQNGKIDKKSLLLYDQSEKHKTDVT